MDKATVSASADVPRAGELVARGAGNGGNAGEEAGQSFDTDPPDASARNPNGKMHPRAKANGVATSFVARGPCMDYRRKPISRGFFLDAD